MATKRGDTVRGPICNAAPYKHQWSVIEAVAALRRATSIDIRLRLVGGGRGPAIARLRAAMGRFDPNDEFVETLDFVPHDEIPAELAAADLFCFASSCENLPITLLEAMASGIPICSSDRGPMPEVLGRDACYFDPEVPSSIAEALKRMIEDDEYRELCRAVSLARLGDATPGSGAEKTWQTLAQPQTNPPHDKTIPTVQQLRHGHFRQRHRFRRRWCLRPLPDLSQQDTA